MVCGLRPLVVILCRGGIAAYSRPASISGRMYLANRVISRVRMCEPSTSASAMISTRP